MLWCLTPAGFLAGLAGVYRWRRRGAILVPVLGIFVGGGVALAALLYPDPSQTDPCPPNQVFAAVIGVVSSVFWLFGSSVGIVTGFALWPSRPQKNSDGDTAPTSDACLDSPRNGLPASTADRPANDATRANARFRKRRRNDGRR